MPKRLLENLPVYLSTGTYWPQPVSRMAWATCSAADMPVSRYDATARFAAKSLNRDFSTMGCGP
ncbi:MAG: hypothetical protein A6D92_04725 [Symbiobacterium thermophilum]|uniref:Uncharacterized protein n=1 Tax=Symbiobacterium thermophilum TaxID=2734 RepID=A0A1Y2T7A6_SYMTR|nr:MAG: hypothetical protein A6D92_04725 [Symbiobacterium thermophilum]